MGVILHDLRLLPSPATKVPALISKLLDAFIGAIEPLTARFSSSTRWVALVEGDAISLHEVRKGSPTSRGRLSVEGSLDESERKLIRSGASKTVELRLPPEQILHRTLHLPQAGKDFLEPIIEHRLERLTPWKPEHVLYGFRIIGEPEADGSIAVAFAATSAEIAAEPARRLEAIGLAPTVLGTSGEPIDAPSSIDLYRGKRSRVRAQLRRSTAIVLSAAAVALAPACVASFWVAYASEQRLHSVEERLSNLRARLPAAGSTKAEQAHGRERTLLEAKRPERSLLMLIDRLGSALPSNTYLRELDIDPRKIRLVGRSGNAPALIGLLEAKATLAQVQFAAPVTRDGENRDDFEIVATRIVPEAEGAR